MVSIFNFVHHYCIPTPLILFRSQRRAEACDEIEVGEASDSQFEKLFFMEGWHVGRILPGLESVVEPGISF